MIQNLNLKLLPHSHLKPCSFFLFFKFMFSLSFRFGKLSLYVLKFTNPILCHLLSIIKPILHVFSFGHPIFQFYNFHLFLFIISVLGDEVFYFLICYKRICKNIFMISALKSLMENSKFDSYQSWG